MTKFNNTILPTNTPMYSTTSKNLPNISTIQANNYSISHNISIKELLDQGFKNVFEQLLFVRSSWRTVVSVGNAEEREKDEAAVIRQKNSIINRLCGSKSLFGRCQTCQTCLNGII